MDSTRPNAVVSFREELSERLWIVRVSPDGCNVPDFLPGQYTTLGLLGSAARCALAEAENPPAPPDKLIRRAYSIASSPDEKQFLEFYLNLVDEGALTPRLFNLNVGDRLWLGNKIAGNFTCAGLPADVNVAFIATGTGLAPYMSMLRAHRELDSPRHVALLHGVRHSWDLGYRSSLLAMEQARENFVYVPIVSRPQNETQLWSGAIGHVQETWKGPIFHEHWAFHPKPENTHVFLCGNPRANDSMITLLAEEGFKEHTRHQAGQIHVENYWPI